MVDIYGRTPLNYGGGFRHDGAKLTINGAAGGDGIGLATIVQQFSIAYQKRLTKIFEFGQANFYFVEGPPDGQAQFDNIVGPKGLVLTFAKQLGDVCTVNKNSLTLGFGTGCQATGTGAATGVSVLTMRHALVDSFSLTGEAQSAMVRSQARLMFGSLEEGK